jgi:hypothetical protein
MMAMSHISLSIDENLSSIFFAARLSLGELPRRSIEDFEGDVLTLFASSTKKTWLGTEIKCFKKKKEE